MLKARHIVIGAGAALAVYGVSYVMKLNRLSNELETATKVTIHNVSLEGIELRIDVVLKNPSGGSIQVKHPFVKMLYGSSTVASSQLKDVNIKLPKFSEVNLEPIMITIGFLNLATTVPALLNEYRSTGKLTVVVKTITTINGGIPYSKTDTLTLGGGTQA